MLDLLPALPDGAPDGSVTGLVARPGLIVDLDWTGSRVRARLRVRAAAGVGRHVVRHGHHTVEIEVGPDEAVELTFDQTLREMA
jgi:alpha-L-fucosidase 2